MTCLIGYCNLSTTLGHKNSEILLLWRVITSVSWLFCIKVPRRCLGRCLASKCSSYSISNCGLFCCFYLIVCKSVGFDFIYPSFTVFQVWIRLIYSLVFNPCCRCTICPHLQRIRSSLRVFGPFLWAVLFQWERMCVPCQWWITMESMRIPICA